MATACASSSVGSTSTARATLGHHPRRAEDAAQLFQHHRLELGRRQGQA